MKTELISIGDELLIGQVINTNAAWMGRALNGIGLSVDRSHVIADDPEVIMKTLEEAFSRADVLLLTGGLGPTKDDMTKEVLCDFFQSKLVLNEQALENVEAIMRRANRPMIQSNRNQALVPDNCHVIQNSRGTAPGIWFEKDGKYLGAMPGVPNEMKGMMESFILPALQQGEAGTAIAHKTLLVAGIGESFLAERLKEIENNLPSHIKLAYLPHVITVRLRLTARGINREELEKELAVFGKAIREQVAEHVLADEDTTLEEILLNRLRDRKETLSLAESCTGGYMAHMITAISGASDVFSGGMVAYANAAKIELLDVNAQTLSECGAVSEETVLEMAAGALGAFNTDYAIASSGVLGPNGGSADKPIGTVWLAATDKSGRVITQKLHLGTNREMSIKRAAINGLYLLYRLITKS